MSAIIIADDITYTRAELTQSASQVAAGLAAAGIQEGDVVAVMLKNSIEYLEIIMACRQLGCYYCPINWHFTAAEIQYILDDSEAKALITTQAYFEPLQQTLSPTLSVWLTDTHDHEKNYATWKAAQPFHQAKPVSPRGHMAYTSGTTGKPKGVVRHAFPIEELSERQAVADSLVEEAYGLKPGVRALLSAPIYHSAPSLYAQVALRKADVFIVTERFDAHKILQLIEKHQIEAVYMVPIMYARLLRLDEDERNRYDLSSLKFVVSTGSPCPPETKQAMMDWFGPVIYETYASSEAGLVTLIRPEEVKSHPGSVGKPLANGIVRIYDEQGMLCPPGTVGRIFVHQPAYADFSYKGNPAARLEIEHEGLISLGDMGWLDEEGHLYVTDRESDMVISGGVNIYPAEIEQHLLQHVGIADCVVIGVPDAEFGERLLALVQPVADKTLDADELRAWLKPRLAGFKIPRDFEFRAILPRDDNGKIKKRALRNTYWKNHATKV